MLTSDCLNDGLLHDLPETAAVWLSLSSKPMIPVKIIKRVHNNNQWNNFSLFFTRFFLRLPILLNGEYFFGPFVILG